MNKITNEYNRVMGKLFYGIGIITGSIAGVKMIVLPELNIVSFVLPCALSVGLMYIGLKMEVSEK